MNMYVRMYIRMHELRLYACPSVNLEGSGISISALCLGPGLG
jgi:hypothetical protein